jgi:hypothetical protein
VGGAYSSVVTMSAFPAPTITLGFEGTDTVEVRPYKYSGVSNNAFTYTPQINKKMTLSVTGSLSNYQNYLTIKKITFMG